MRKRKDIVFSELRTRVPQLLGCTTVILYDRVISHLLQISFHYSGCFLREKKSSNKGSFETLFFLHMIIYPCISPITINDAQLVLEAIDIGYLYIIDIIPITQNIIAHTFNFFPFNIKHTSYFTRIFIFIIGRVYAAN